MQQHATILAPTMREEAMVNQWPWVRSWGLIRYCSFHASVISEKELAGYRQARCQSAARPIGDTITSQWRFSTSVVIQFGPVPPIAKPSGLSGREPRGPKKPSWQNHHENNSSCVPALSSQFRVADCSSPSRACPPTPHPRDWIADGLPLERGSGTLFSIVECIISAK